MSFKELSNSSEKVSNSYYLSSLFTYIVCKIIFLETYRKLNSFFTISLFNDYTSFLIDIIWFLGVRRMSPAYSSRVEHLCHTFTQMSEKRREKKTRKKDAKKRREKKMRKKDAKKDAHHEKWCLLDWFICFIELL